MPSSSSQAFDYEDEEALLQRALQLSMMEANNFANEKSTQNQQVDNSMNVSEIYDEEEEAMRQALQMSMEPSNFVNELLKSANVDSNDPLVQAVMAQVSDDKQKKDDKKKEDETNNDKKDANDESKKRKDI